MNISQINRFERLRDGGSLIASFKADDSCDYWVMFPIDRSKGMNIENPEFKAPLLVNRTSGSVEKMSREQARDWLNRLEPYFDKCEELPYVSKQAETDILDKMVTLCETGT